MPRIVATTSCQASSAVAPGDVESDAAAPKSSHKHHKHHKKGNGQAGGVVARMTQTLKSAVGGGGASSPSSKYSAKQIGVTPPKKHRELADQRKHRHPEDRVEHRQFEKEKDSRSLEEVRKERLEREWYNAHRPEISEDMTTSERPAAAKITFRKTMSAPHPTARVAAPRPKVPFF